MDYDLRDNSRQLEESMIFLNSLDFQQKQIPIIKQQLIALETLTKEFDILLIEKNSLEESLNQSNIVKSNLIMENGTLNYQVYQLEKQNGDLQYKIKNFEEREQQLNLTNLENELCNKDKSIEGLNMERANLQKENKRLAENNSKLLTYIIDLEQALEAQEINNKLEQEKLRNNFEKQLTDCISENNVLQNQLELLNQQIQETQKYQNTLISRMSLTMLDDVTKLDQTIEFDQYNFEGLQLTLETKGDESIESEDEFQKDFFGIKDNPIIRKLYLKDKDQKKRMKVFSDSIFRINIKGIKSKRIMFITEVNCYFFDEYMVMTRQFPLIQIKSISCAENNSMMCCFHQNNDDYLFECLKRQDIIQFLEQIISCPIQYQDNFLVVFKNYKPKQLQQLGNDNCYRSLNHQGFMQLWQKRMFGHSMQEVFALLSDVGLLLFKHIDDLVPILLIPTFNTIIIKNPINYKGHVLKIKYKESDYILSVNSEALLDEWYTVINRQIVTNHKYNLTQQQQQQQQQQILLQKL